MELRSLAYRTDLMFFRHGASRVEDRGDCLAIRSPANPTYYWGNFLLFPAPPLPGQMPQWWARFEDEFRDSPEVRHRTFGWAAPDGDPGAIEEFRREGASLVDSVAMSASEVQAPPHLDPGLQIRPLETEKDWAEVTASQIQIFREDHEPQAFAAFTERAMAHNRGLVRSGLGRWFGGYVDGALAGSLGIFAEDGLARFQSVSTLPQFRRRGVCQSLVYSAARYALREKDARQLVIVADTDAPVGRVYASVGFRPTERQFGAWWPPQAVPAAGVGGQGGQRGATM